jgi:hypothetical protein
MAAEIYDHIDVRKVASTVTVDCPLRDGVLTEQK